MSKFLISEVPALQNLRTSPMKRLKDSSDVARSKAWNLAKNKFKLNECCDSIPWMTVLLKT